MVACGGVPEGVPSAVLSVWFGPDNKYSFVEMCSAECAQIAMSLSGIMCMDFSLRINRPKTYVEGTNPATGFMNYLPGEAGEES